MPDVQKALQAILTTINAPGFEPKLAPGRPVVCLSRDYGSGGDEIAKRLAQRLGVEVFDRVILDRIAQRINAEPETMRAIDAVTSPLRHMWLYSLVTGQDLSADRYKRHLIDIVLSLGRHGGVILGSGAHLILARSGALRVRICGTTEICAKRVADAEGMGLDSAKRRVEQVNSDRGKFIWEHFQERVNDPRTFDLIVNTDHITDYDKVVDMLIDALKMVGQAVPARGQI